jgi:2-amino-4-hydroxy-6-hydroxymethyldihydropteridine diphosphokinase
MDHTAYIAMGSNLGDRRSTIVSAMEALRADEGVLEVEVSGLLETDPVGGPAGQERYLNGAARVRTTRDAGSLLTLMLAIEKRLGRRRRVPCGPRSIDLDLLLFDDAVIDQPGLTVPHPRMCERWFVLKPLAEIAGEVIHPITRQSIREMLANLKGD